MHYRLLRIVALLLTLTTLTLAIFNNASALEATDAVVIRYPFLACDVKYSRRTLNVPIDRCFSAPIFNMEIVSTAICANGTRALWARFRDKRCGYGTLDTKFGLVELEDKHVRSCLEVLEIGSMAFWCDGVEKSSPDDEDERKKPEDDDKSQKGSVSESICTIRTAPVWNHPKADTCVDLESERFQVTSPAICANGTQSTLALYKDTGCLGAPSEFRAVEAAKGRECSDVEGMKSFAFYCTGEGIEGSGGGEHRRNGKTGGIMQFLLVLTLIIMMFSLIMVLSILKWVRTYGGSMGKVIETVRNLIKPKEGAIAI